MNKRTLKGWVATDGPIDGHPDLRVDLEMLAELADRLRSGQMPFQFDHDSDKPIKSRVLLAEVRQLENGDHGVWAEIEVFGDDQTISELEMRKGFSIAFTKALPRTDHPRTSNKPKIAIFVDAINFGSAAALEAARTLSPEFDVQPGLLYQLWIVPPPKIIIYLGIEALKSIADGLFFDTLKKLMSRSKQSKTSLELEFRVTTPKGNVDARLKTSNPTEAKQALKALRDITKPLGKSIVYDLQGKRWRKK